MSRGIRNAMAGAAMLICGGCFGAAAITTVAPMVVAGTAQIVGAQVAMRDSNGSGVPTDDKADRCDQLLRATPGVEELRKTKDAIIESRQWKIAANAGTPTWMLVRERNAPEDAWMPKPGVANLNFKPPLGEMLKTNEPQFLAYAPAEVQAPYDSELFDAMTSAFGPGMGTFEWRARIYSYVIVKELPCFKAAKK